MVQNMANIDAALKEYYLPPAREQLNNKTMMLAQIERTSRHVEGRRAVLSLHVERNHGVGARAEGATLPTAQNQTWAEQRVGLAHNYLRIHISGQVLKGTASDAGSFVRGLDAEMRHGVEDLRRDVNRQCFNNTLQTIAQCGVTSASTTVVLAADTGNTAMRQFEVGMLVDVGTTADPDSLAAASEITAVDRSSSPPTITISDSVTTTASHYVSRTGNAGNELIGLREIVTNSGTLHNVNPATYDIWKSTVLANGGATRPTTDNLIEEAIDTVDLDTGEAAPNFGVCSKGVRRNFAAQLKAQKRFDATSSTDLKGGFKALTVDCGDVTIPIIGERDCPNNTMFLLNLEHIIQHEMSDWEWMNEDGSVLARVSGKDEYEATMFKYHQLCTDRRAAHAQIQDLDEGS
jgi:hypothetical protein